MGKKQGTQTVNQDPWGPSQANLQFGLSELDRLYGGRAPTREQFTTTTAPVMGEHYYEPGTGALRQRQYQPGSSVFDQAGYDKALAEFQARPQPGMQPFVPEYGLLDPAASELMSTIRGEKLFSNPNLDEMIRRASADVNSQFSGMGRYGSGAHQDQLFSKAAAPFRYADYAQERANQLAAVQQAPGFEMTPYQRYSARVSAPYEPIKNYLDLVNPIGRGGASSSSPIYKNPLTGVVGGALSGATLGAMMAPATATGLAAVGGWPFLLGGALLGATL